MCNSRITALLAWLRTVRLQEIGRQALVATLLNDDFREGTDLQSYDSQKFNVEIVIIIITKSPMNLEAMVHRI